jgi:hypothetical protein
VAFGALAVGSDFPQIVQGYQLLLMQRGGTIFNRDGDLDIETPEAEEALRFAVDGLRSGFFSTVSDYFGPSMQRALKTNRVLGVNMPTWYAAAYGIKPNVPEQSGLWRVRALPRFTGGGGRTAVGGGTGFAALRGKPNTEASVGLIISTYLDPAQQVKRYRDLGYLPTLRSVYDDPQLLTIGEDYFGGQKLFEIYKDIVDEVPSLYQSQNQSIMTTVLSDYLLRAYRGDLSPAQALSAATALPERGRGRHGRHQRAHPGADGLLQLRRLEELAVRRQPRPRRRGRALLHPRQGHHQPLARPQPRRNRIRLPPKQITPTLEGEACRPLGGPHRSLLQTRKRLMEQVIRNACL